MALKNILLISFIFTIFQNPGHTSRSSGTCRGRFHSLFVCGEDPAAQRNTHPDDLVEDSAPDATANEKTDVKSYTRSSSADSSGNVHHASNRHGSMSSNEPASSGDNAGRTESSVSSDGQRHKEYAVFEDNTSYKEQRGDTATINLADNKTEVPLSENGLLVLDHENLLDTMMGKSFSYNTSIDTTRTNVNHETSSSINSQFSSKLLLLAFYEPWCQKANEMIRKLEDATRILQHKFATTSSLQFASEKNIPQPMFGKMDTSAFEHEDLVEFFTLFDNTHNGLPVLKFVFIERHMHEYEGDQDKIEDGDVNHNNNGLERTIIDFVGDSKTAEDIVETVIHYWYRFVVSGHVTFETLQLGPYGKNDETEEKEYDIEITHNDGHDPIRPIFALPDLPSILLFVQGHKKLFHPTMQELTSVSEREETYIRELLVAESGEDPYLGFVQCRNNQRQSQVPDDVVALYQQFDDLAQTFIYRRDVAFFVVASEDCHWISNGSYIDANAEYAWNGHVRVLKLDSSRQNLQNPDWWQLGDTFPSTTATGLSTSDYHSNMTHYMIVQSTPTVLWFDKVATSALAFPLYRKVHLVLFIDMHTPRLKDGSFNYTSIAYKQSKHAISNLRESALNHRLNRPKEDVVFLIIPSTEVQILTTFGIDIWSSIDEECTKSDLRRCHPDNIPLLPMAMITSRRESNSTMFRYYLDSDKLLNQENKNENEVNEFLSNFFAGNLSHHVQSESDSSSVILPSGVQILNGNNFDKMVMQSKKHSIVQFTASYCGHCKRFNVIWDELAILIKEFRWDAILDVMTIDVTKNEVNHEMIDVQNVPSVYFFPSSSKEVPLQLRIKGKNREEELSNIGEINEASSIIEWIIDLNILDEKELLNLIEKGVVSDL